MAGESWESLRDLALKLAFGTVGAVRVAHTWLVPARHNQLGPR